MLVARLADEHPRVREHAVRLSEAAANDSPELRAKLVSLSGDDDLRVRYQLAFTLGELKDATRVPGLAAIARRDAADSWIRLALLSSLSQGAGEVLATSVDGQAICRQRCRPGC